MLTSPIYDAVYYPSYSKFLGATLLGIITGGKNLAFHIAAPYSLIMKSLSHTPKLEMQPRLEISYSTF